MHGSPRRENMRTRLELLASAVGVVLVAVSAASGAASLEGPGTIRITSRQVTHIHVDGGRPGRGAGDLDFYRQLLYNKRITPKAIGHSDVTCTNTGTGSMSCDGTYFLPKGKIMVGGVIGARLFYELAVYGGTGLYDNARGTVTATYLGGLPPQEFLVFRLTT
jgi:hypothetical protein